VSHFCEKLKTEEYLEYIPSYARIRKILLVAKLIEPTQKRLVKHMPAGIAMQKKDLCPTSPLNYRPCTFVFSCDNGYC